MTSRYRAGQRVAAIISELQDQGLSTSEIALELQQRGVLMRGAAADPVADLCDNVRDIVADFAAAVGQPADEVTALRARAEAAEQRAEAAEAELARARADARVLVGFIVGLERHGWAEAELVPAGITDAEVRALTAAYDVAYRLPATEMIAVIRRALGGAA